MLLKAFPEIDNPVNGGLINPENGGLVTIEYKMIGFNENEYFRIGMDGISFLLNNTNSVGWE